MPNTPSPEPEAARVERYARALAAVDQEDYAEFWREYDEKARAAIELADQEIAAVATPGRASEPDAMVQLEQDDCFAREFREAVRVAGAHGNMEPYARVLSGRLRQMDKRARAANKAAEDLRVENKRLRAAALAPPAQADAAETMEEVEPSNDELLGEFHNAIVAMLERFWQTDAAEDLAEVAGHLGSFQDARAAVLARMSSPALGRAAEAELSRLRAENVGLRTGREADLRPGLKEALRIIEAGNWPAPPGFGETAKKMSPEDAYDVGTGDAAMKIQWQIEDALKALISTTHGARHDGI